MEQSSGPNFEDFKNREVAFLVAILLPFLTRVNVSDVCLTKIHLCLCSFAVLSMALISLAVPSRVNGHVSKPWYPGDPPKSLQKDYLWVVTNPKEVPWVLTHSQIPKVKRAAERPPLV